MTEYLGFDLDELCDCVYANQPYSFFEDEEHCRTMLHKYFDNYPNRDDVSHEEVAKKFFEDCMPELCKMYEDYIIWLIDIYIPLFPEVGTRSLRAVLKNPPTPDVFKGNRYVHVRKIKDLIQSFHPGLANRSAPSRLSSSKSHF